MKFHIVKAHRRGSLHPYMGATCENAGVPQNKVYTDFRAAQADASKLTLCNPCGFIVVDNATGLEPGVPPGLYTFNELYAAHEAWQKLPKGSDEWNKARVLYCAKLVEHVEPILDKDCFMESDLKLLWKGRTGLGVRVNERDGEGPLFNFGDDVLIEFFPEHRGALAVDEPLWMEFSTLTAIVPGVHDDTQFATPADFVR